MYKLAVAMVLAGSSAFATGQNCAPYKPMKDGLAKQYGEYPVVEGMGASNNMMEMYSNQETGTWTILTVFPNGIACAVASGDFFEFSPKPKTEPNL